jgi:hypothetical protein
LTSFERWGHGVLDFFAASSDYDLVFAPHILIRQWARRFGYDLDLSRYTGCKNILVDWASERSIDLTYTSLGDIYLGDVSSQVSEWVAGRPRPCVFLNAHGVAWRGDPNYRFWDYGPVVEDLADLGPALARSSAPEYLRIQAERIDGYIERSDEPASLRAANALIDFCNASAG